MEKRPKHSELHRLSEERLSQKQPGKGRPRILDDTERILQELRVYQIELELQNEELKKTRGAIEDSLEQYTDLYDFAPVGYLNLDRRGAILKTNLLGAKLLGLKSGQLIDRRFQLFLADKDRPAFSAFLEQVVNSRVKAAYEVEIPKEAGAGLFVRIEAAVSGRKPECRLVLVDITEQKKAEETLRVSEQFLKTILSSIDEGIIVYDRDLRYRIWNRFMEKRTGFPAKKVLGKKAVEVFPFLRTHRIDQIFEKALAGKTHSVQDIPYRSPETGEKAFYAGTFGPHKNGKGEIIGVVAVLKDVSERRQMEAQLSHSKEMKLLGQLAAGMAHEVRNPLNAILAINEALFKDIGDNPEYQPYLMHIKEQINRLSNLMKDLLEF